MLSSMIAVCYCCIMLLAGTASTSLAFVQIIPSTRAVTSAPTTAICASTLDEAEQSGEQQTFTVDGVICRKVSLDLPLVGAVSVLEATAESQSELVKMAALLDQELQENSAQSTLDFGDPYGAVLWPASWAVSRFLLEDLVQDPKDKHTPLEGLSICELGSGTGLVSLAALKGGAARVFATDYEKLALSLTKFAVQTLNSCDMERIQFQQLDMCDFDTPLPDVDVVVAADIMYEVATGTAMAHRAVEALKKGCRVIIGDSPGRPGRMSFLKTLQELGLKDARFEESAGRTCTGPRDDLICGPTSQSVSDVEQELQIAIMDLNPSFLPPSN